MVEQGHDVTLFASGDSCTRARLVPLCSRALRLVAGCPRERWAAPGVKGVSVRPAYEALLEGLANRGVHESLVAARARLGNIPRYHRGTHGGIPGLSVAPDPHNHVGSAQRCGSKWPREESNLSTRISKSACGSTFSEVAGAWARRNRGRAWAA